MARALTVQLLRGTTAQRLADTPALGELVLDTTLLAGGTTGPVFVGDGVVAGGKAIDFGGVTSAFGRAGVVVAANGDYTAANITNVPAGALAATDVQAALNELQGDITALAAVGATNYIAGALNPTAADGVDGNFFLNVASGDVFGAKAAGVWPAVPITNVLAQLGLSAVAGAAPTAAGTVGVGTVAARSDHSHRFQTALETPSTASGTITATNVDGAIAQIATQVAAAAAASTWLSLTDTPAAFTALNIVRGNAAGTALEMVSILDAGTL